MSNYNWRPSDPSVKTQHKYDMEADRWVSAFSSATSKANKPNAFKDIPETVNSALGLIVVVFGSLYFIIEFLFKFTKWFWEIFFLIDTTAIFERDHAVNDLILRDYEIAFAIFIQIKSGDEEEYPEKYVGEYGGLSFVDFLDIKEVTDESEPIGTHFYCRGHVLSTHILDHYKYRKEPRFQHIVNEFAVITSFEVNDYVFFHPNYKRPLL